MVLASEFIHIPATCEGTTTSLTPIFRCNAFVETGGEGAVIYGYNCEARFFTDRERAAHQRYEHGWGTCACGRVVTSWEQAKAHRRAVAQSRLGLPLTAVEWTTKHIITS